MATSLVRQQIPPSLADQRHLDRWQLRSAGSHSALLDRLATLHHAYRADCSPRISRHVAQFLAVADRESELFDNSDRFNITCKTDTSDILSSISAHTSAS